jgi:GNAT superfamily N-acetyltransferase
MKVIREACACDYENIVLLLQQLSIYDPVAEVEWFSDSSNQGYVVEGDSKIIGFLSWHEIKKVRGGNVFIIEDVVVDHSYRGCGVGKRMISHAIKDIRKKRGAYKIILESSAIGEALYKSCGFQKSNNNLYKLMVT